MELQDVESELDVVDPDSIDSFLDNFIQSNLMGHELFFNISISEKIRLLDFLADEALNSWPVRKTIDRRLDILEAIENERTKLRFDKSKERSVIHLISSFSNI